MRCVCPFRTPPCCCVELRPWRARRWRPMVTSSSGLLCPRANYNFNIGRRWRMCSSTTTTSWRSYSRLPHHGRPRSLFPRLRPGWHETQGDQCQWCGSGHWGDIFSDKERRCPAVWRWKQDPMPLLRVGQWMYEGSSLQIRPHLPKQGGQEDAMLVLWVGPSHPEGLSSEDRRGFSIQGWF